MHNGFYQSYTANDFGKKIVHRVCELVSSHDWDWTKVRDTQSRLLRSTKFTSIFHCLQTRAVQRPQLKFSKLSGIANLLL